MEDCSWAMEGHDSTMKYDRSKFTEHGVHFYVIEKSCKLMKKKKIIKQSLLDSILDWP